jgi:putative ubiquitin-RnfH superfamily antitoxin RatB of RatAB toxin-antitoxin module
MAPAEALRVEVVYCPQPGVDDRVALQLPEGATLVDALHASGVLTRHGLALEGLRVGIWCKAKELTTPLRDRDRVEVYRPLTVDPKEARRIRYKRHKAT